MPHKTQITGIFKWMNKIRKKKKKSTHKKCLCNQKNYEKRITSPPLIYTLLLTNNSTAQIDGSFVSIDVDYFQLLYLTNKKKKN